MKYKPSIVAAYFVSCGLPKPEFELRFHHERKWRWDVAWPWRVGLGVFWPTAIEVQGGSFALKLGAHSRGGHLRKQYEKHNEAMAMGWRVLQVFPEDLCTLATVNLVKRCLGIEL